MAATVFLLTIFSIACLVWCLLQWADVRNYRTLWRQEQDRYETLLESRSELGAERNLFLGQVKELSRMAVTLSGDLKHAQDIMSHHSDICEDRINYYKLKMATFDYDWHVCSRCGYEEDAKEGRTRQDIVEMCHETMNAEMIDLDNVGGELVEYIARGFTDYECSEARARELIRSILTGQIC